MKFNTSWKESVQPRKQRKYRHNAPKHVQQNFMSVNLSKALRKEHGLRSLGVRKGDKVKVLRGQFRGKSGEVERVDRNKERVYIAGVQLQKKDGSAVSYPVHPSNVQLESVDMKDKTRGKKEAKKASKPAKKAAPASKPAAKPTASKKEGKSQ